MKTTLLLVRHGESLGNLHEKFLGHTNLGLSPLGERQAEALAARLADVAIDLVYSSDLCRAANTVLPTAKEHGLTVIPDERLREVFAGKWEEMSFDEIGIVYPEDRALWKNNIGLSCPTGGERVADLLVRVRTALDEIAARHPGKTVLVGTHATPIRAITAQLRGYPLDRMVEVPWAPNASITTVEYENGTPRLLTEADAAHLEGIVTYVPKKI